MLFEDLTLIVDRDPHGSAVNMAVDEVLLRGAGKPLLRSYRWARPAASFGYFGSLVEAQRAAPGRELVRRWTGGGIVLHGKDFTYTLVVPQGDAFSAADLRESYRVIHAAIATLLTHSGGPVRLARGSAQTRVSDACFENPVQHDVVAGDVKLAGAAQRRTRWGLLHQGSVQAGESPSEFSEALASSLSANVSARALSNEELACAQELARIKYATDEWLHRR